MIFKFSFQVENPIQIAFMNPLHLILFPIPKAAYVIIKSDFSLPMPQSLMPTSIIDITIPIYHMPLFLRFISIPFPRIMIIIFTALCVSDLMSSSMSLGVYPITLIFIPSFLLFKMTSILGAPALKLAPIFVSVLPFNIKIIIILIIKLYSIIRFTFIARETGSCQVTRMAQSACFTLTIFSLSRH